MDSLEAKITGLADAIAAVGDRHLNSCDGGHETLLEVRRLDLGGDGGALLCMRCYSSEMAWRAQRNRKLDLGYCLGVDLEDGCKFDLPSWADLEVDQKAVN